MGSNPPGSTITTSKDVHGRLFLCLKSSNHGAFSTYSVLERPCISVFLMVFQACRQPFLEYPS